MAVTVIETVLRYTLTGPTHLLFNIEAAHCDSQRIVSEQLHFSPPLQPHRYSDNASGNRFIRLNAETGPLEIRYQATVALLAPPADANLPETPVCDLPDDTLHYLMPTRYCESDLIGAEALQHFGHLAPGRGRVQAIVDWIHDSIRYEIGSSGSTTTAREVLAQRAGVCRDFAHLGITFCRALNIPARLVVGYVYFDEPPQDFHAVFEAWLGNRWVMFDPTGMVSVDDLVRIGTGRDAKDVAFGTMFGPPVQMTHMEIQISQHASSADAASAVPERQAPLLSTELAPTA